jgi:hypothetical protein
MPSVRSASNTPPPVMSSCRFPDPALLAEHPDVQVRDVLTGRLDQVLHGLDHPGANPGRAGS